ncbi:MAG: ATPase [Rhodospirillales bacterium]|nr:ATPase [Rhodospirillales bacterium]
MKLTAAEFRNWPQKSITLLGMSGVGKTRLSSVLAKDDWFHYSGDYRIGSHYLNEHILDNIKRQMMDIPFLMRLLRGNALKVQSNVTIDNLAPVSSFLGKLGDPEKGGLPLKEFKRRQKLHLDAEIAAMKDVPHFIARARDMYGFRNFINDAGGSLCELDNDDVLQTLAENTVILYIKATEDDEKELIARAVSHPKPLFYREAFLDEHLARYMKEKNLEYAALIDPDDFTRWVFPHLFRSRLPRYQAIADTYGYTVAARDMAAVTNENDFLKLMDKVLATPDRGREAA